MSAMKRDIYTEDHDDFRSAVRTWIERDVLPHTDEYIAAKALPREFWLKAGENGFLGLALDEEYGGAGDFRFNAVLNEELAKVGAAYPTCVGIHVDITAPYINELGTPEQKERWLPGMASGEILAAIGMTEPGGGSDLGQLLVEDGVEAEVARPAVVLVEREPEEAVLAGLQPELARQRLGLDVLIGVRKDVPLDPGADRGAEVVVVLGVDLTLHGAHRTP